MFAYSADPRVAEFAVAAMLPVPIVALARALLTSSVAARCSWGEVHAVSIRAAIGMIFFMIIFIELVGAFL